jgi:lysyl-tRNA synthetase class I
MSGLADRTIDIKCPACGRTTRKSIGWVKNNTSFTCSCGAEIKLDSSEFKATIVKEEAEFKRQQ